MRDHGILLFMPPQLVLGLIKFQAKQELGKSYAGLYLLNDALFRQGCITRETYEVFEKKYSTPLLEQEIKPLPKPERENQNHLMQIEKTLTNAYQEWDKIKPSAQAFHVKTAKKHDDLPIAQLILKEKVKG